MKIKYITNVRIPTERAHGYAIMKMCESFSLSNIDINLIVPEKQNSELKENPFDYYGIQKIFKITKIPSFDFLGNNLSFGKIFYWLDFLSFIFSIRMKNVIEKDDILYTRDFTLAYFFPKKNFSCLELHNIPKKHLWLKESCKKVNLIFVLNNNIKKELVELGIPENKIFIFSSGVDLKDFDLNITTEEARKKINLPIDKKIIMYTGHLYKWKKIDTLADVAIKMPENIFCFIGGVDPEISFYKEKYKNVKNILWIEFVKREYIPFYIKSADVLVLPYTKNENISSKYTSPLKLFEYMASKKPIVASDLSSTREILNESMCVFCEPDDVNSLEISIKKILSDENLAKNISENAYKNSFKYSWKNRAEKISLIIKNNIYG